MLQRATPPPFIIPEVFTIPLAQKFEMENGNTLYSINSSTEALLKIDVFFPAGRIKQPQASIASLCIDMLFEGTKKRSAMEMAEALDYFGAYTDYSVKPEWACITLYTLNKYLTSVLPLFVELLVEPSFDEGELKQLVAREIQDLKVSLEKNSVLAQRKAAQLLWGENHPWGMLPSIENYNNISRATIQQFFDKNYDISKAKIFVAGNIDDTVIKNLNSAFSIYNNNTNVSDIKQNETSVLSVAANVFVEKPKSLQAALRIVRKHVQRTHPDYNDCQILNLLLGGYFGSRLMDNLREDKGYTYGIGSSISDYSFGSDWIIGTEVKNEIKEEAVNEIYFEMKRLSEELVNEEELTVARNYALGQILRSLDGAYNLMHYAEIAELNSYNYSVFYSGFERIKNITPQELMLIAQKYFKKEDWLTVVCGSSKKINK